MNQIEISEKEPFDIEDYLSNIHNEDGAPLTMEQRESYKKAIQKNGLATIGNDGLAIMVVQPIATH